MELQEIKSKIVEGIKQKYNMTVSAFCKSDIPEKLGLTPGNGLRISIQGKTSSFSNYRALFKDLGLGNLTRKMTSVRQTTYFLEQPKGRTIGTPAKAGSGKAKSKTVAVQTKTKAKAPLGKKRL